MCVRAQLSCVVDISKEDFLRVYHGISVAEIGKMCFSRRIQVHGFKFRELQVRVCGRSEGVQSVVSWCAHLVYLCVTVSLHNAPPGWLRYTQRRKSRRSLVQCVACVTWWCRR